MPLSARPGNSLPSTPAGRLNLQAASGQTYQAVAFNSSGVDPITSKVVLHLQGAGGFSTGSLLGVSGSSPSGGAGAVADSLTSTIQAAAGATGSAIRSARLAAAASAVFEVEGSSRSHAAHLVETGGVVAGTAGLIASFSKVTDEGVKRAIKGRF